MSRLIVAFFLFTCLCGRTFAAGWTPFIPPPPVPEQGVPFLKDDGAYPKYQEIYAEIQEHYGSSEEAARAGRAIGQLQKDFPTSPYPFFALAELKYMIAIMNGGNPNSNVEVNAILDHVMRRNGANLPDGYILMAKMAANQNQAEAALDKAAVAVKFAPNKPEAQFALARAEHISQHYANAEAAYRKFLMLEQSPLRRANIYQWLGKMYSNFARPRSDRDADRAKAMEAYRMSAELGPTYRHIDAYATFLLTDMGDQEAAAPYFASMLKKDPNDQKAKFNLGLVEYLRWAKANKNGGSAAQLDEIGKRSGLNKEDSFVVSASFDGMGEVTSAMLRSKVIRDVNVICLEAYNTFPNTSAIFNAALADNVALVKELVDHGANVNAQGYAHRTPLMSALFAADVDLVAYLLKKGARTNVVADQEVTPMGIAVSNLPQSGPLVKLLLKYKADPTGLGGNGQPLAIVAATRHNLGALDALITVGGVEVNLKNADGLNLLFYSLGDPDLIRLLLSKGADPWQPVGQGDLMDFAKGAINPSTGMAETVALLEKARKKTPKK